MKVLLLRPKYKMPAYDAPLALALMAGVCRKNGIDVKVADLNFDEIPKGVFDVVGVTGMSSFRQSVIDSINLAKRLVQPKAIIVGGGCATAEYEYLLMNSQADYCCIGEGEVTFESFLQSFPNVKNVKGICYKENNAIRITPTREVSMKLDDLPQAEWSAIPRLERYARVPIYTSRGCPYHCCFCDAYRYVSRIWRVRNPNSVVDEIELLANHYGVKWITFADENPTVNVERFKKICQSIIDRQIKVIFDTDVGTRVDRLPDELLVLMKKAGFRRLQINPESASQRVLDEVIHKDLDISRMFPLAEKCIELGLEPDFRFVIGFPWETKEEVLMTVNAAKKLREMGCYAYIGNAVPMPHTELYDKAKAEGFLRYEGEKLYEMFYEHGLGEHRQEHYLTSPYWEPEWIIQLHLADLKADYRRTIRRFIFTKRGLRKFLRDPRDVFRMIQKALV